MKKMMASTFYHVIYLTTFILSYFMTLHLSDSVSEADSKDSTSEQEEEPASDEDSNAEEEPLDVLAKLKYWSK